MHKKILILYTAHTLGHKSIAENIAYYLQQAGFSVVLRDALQAGNDDKLSGFLKIHTWIYVHAPFIWRWLYLSGYKLTLPLWGITARLYAKKILQVIDEEKPDMVISTQVSPSTVVAYLKRTKKYTGLFGITFSDFHFHPTWAKKEADFFLANIPEQKDELVGRGFAPHSIYVCGITAQPQGVVDAKKTRTKFSIPADAKVVLVGSGSLGVGLPVETIERLLRDVAGTFTGGNGPEVYSIIVCGHNENLYKELLPKFHGTNIHVVGFYQPMEELYAISDLFITKPGGLTTIEALRWCLPMFVTHILPGQEELNLYYLKDKQLIKPLFIEPEDEWQTQVVSELLQGSFRTQLGHNTNRTALLRASDGSEVVRAISEMFHAES